MSQFMYICTAGHVEECPTMGTYASCQALMDLVVNGRLHYAPCGCGVVRVPYDPGLEAAYRVGGSVAVLAMLAERVTDGVGPKAPRRAARRAAR